MNDDMKANFLEYDFLKSFERIDEIIASSDNSFEELDYIPSRDKLTFINGFYVYCSAIFVDIRDSSKLPHNRPKLAKLYRTFISEIVAVMNGNADCAEVNVIGDCVSGIFNTTHLNQINQVFSTAAEIYSLIKVMNYKFEKKKIEQIVIGIGMSLGRALMIKAGFKGSSINEVVWMGDVVNEASKLASYGNETDVDHEIMVSNLFYSNLNEHNKNLLTKNGSRACYHGNVANSEMKKWYNENCK